MRIFGIYISKNKNRLNKIYIRCAGTLTMIAGNLFPMISFAANPIATRTPSNDITLAPGLNRVLYGVDGGLNNDKLNGLKIEKCTGEPSCKEPYGSLDNAIQKGCRECIFTTETFGSGCSVGHTLTDGTNGGATNYTPDACFYTSSGSCAPVVVSGHTITGTCYGSLVAPADVLSAMGCITGSIVESGKIMADNGCVFEPITVNGLSFDVSCPAAYPRDPLPYDRIFIPRTEIFELLIMSGAGGWTEADLGRFFAVQGRRWIKNSDGRIVKAPENIASVQPHYCLYGGCPGIKLIDANANFELIEEPASFTKCTEYGTATWAGTPPNCTVTITSKNCDGASTDPKGVWSKTCSYNE